MRLITGEVDIVVKFPDERSRLEFDRLILEADDLDQPWESIAVRLGGKVVARL